MIPSSAVLPVSHRPLGALLAAALLLSAGTSFAQPSDEEKAAARALALQGADALKSSRFPEALDLVSRAEAIVHAPTHLLMIARAQSGMGKLVAAQETYLKLIREDLAPNAPAAFKNAQATAKEEIAAIEPRIASLRIVAEGAAQKKATIKIDDVTVPPALLGVYRPIDPGHHVIAVQPASGNAVKTPVDLHDAEKREIKLAVPDDAPPEAGKGPLLDAGAPPRDQASSPGFFTPLRGAGIGIGVVGVAGAVVGSLFLAKGFSTASQADSLAKTVCAPPGYTTHCAPASQTQLHGLDSDAAHQKTIGVIALPVGVAALGVGAALLAVGKPAPKTAPAKASVSPWIGGTTGGLQGEF